MNELRKTFPMPTIAEALHVALKQHQAGNLAQAEAIYRQVLQAAPANASALHLMGVLVYQKGSHDAAIQYLCQSLTSDPTDASSHCHLGLAYRAAGKLDEAVASYRQALHLKPDYAEAHNNLGFALAAHGKPAEALACYKQALKLEPNLTDAHLNMGSVLAEQGHVQDAIGCFERVLAVQPDSADAHWNRGIAWLSLGNFEQGWDGYEWRLKREETALRSFRQPLWDGSELAGRTILLHAEQGYGDTIQFIRFAPLVKERGGTVIVECQEPVWSLLRSCAGIDRLVKQGSPLPDFAVHAPLLSLPRILQTTWATLPATVPYLRADAEHVRWWGGEVVKRQGDKETRRQGDKETDGVNVNTALADHSLLITHHSSLLRIGIAWQGNPTHKNDRNRSVPLACFAPLASLSGVQLFSLQKGHGTEQLADISDRLTVTDLGSRFESFQDTAAVLMNLDLVIATDIGVAHCAGALGVPVWVALPFAADWRWMMQREDSPWYPTMRLFRQKTAGDWDEVFQRIMQALRKLRKDEG